MNSNELKKHAKEHGADLIGIASINRFDELPPEKHPRTIFPETKSVVIIGRRITRGTLRGAEEGTNFGNYTLYGGGWLNDRFLAMTTFEVAEYLEDNGWEAVPLPNLPPEVPPMGVTVRKGQPPPNVMLDFDDAAVRAGVGEIGHCGFLLTPTYGPRQRIQMILTDAVIEPTPRLDKAICPGRGACKVLCPLEACASEKELVIAGQRMKVADVDYKKCGRCKNGAHANFSHPAGKPDRLAAVCARSCVDFLEKSGRISNRFVAPFRKREAWTIKENIDFYKV